MRNCKLSLEKVMFKVLKDDKECNTWIERVLRESRDNRVQSTQVNFTAVYGGLFTKKTVQRNKGREVLPPGNFLSPTSKYICL